MFEQSSSEKLSDQIFPIVNHLNLGAHLIKDNEEKINTANLNLMAGKKAKYSNAYPQALEYLTNGINILTDDSWQQNYEMTLDLYTNACNFSENIYRGSV